MQIRPLSFIDFIDRQEVFNLYKIYIVTYSFISALKFNKTELLIKVSINKNQIKYYLLFFPFSL